MTFFEQLVMALRDADPLATMGIVVIAFLMALHSLLSKALRVIEHMNRRRGDP